ncbi:sodium/glutamate symporter [Candidatus Uabimicrobium sp. HlEnr_7]|uniref:sodium/glutamate symporter n=1 Tax=Candidatus Uabimicrobium helgolandensis TaxID=3095367 RepID=UPI003555C539
MNVQLGLIETVGMALVILFVGYFLNNKISLLKKNNIPEPVVGGIAFAIISSILYSQFQFSFNFDMTLKKPLMLVFFTTVGLGASFKLLAQGGPKVVLFLGIATLYLVFQNGIGVFLASITDLNPLSGLLAGSITLSGGHGTGATYAEMFTKGQNLQGTMELAMACATFGLVLGGILGGPVTRRLIQKHNLKPTEEDNPSNEHTITYNPEDDDKVTPKVMMETLLILAVCIVVGSFGYEYMKTLGIPLPSFICPLLVGIVITNTCEYTKIYTIKKESVDLWGTMALSIFLAMALMSLRLWELMNLAGPMLIILIIQTAFLAFYTYNITFRLMGKDYNAAIMAGGHCGFGLGATPTAVANMEALTSKYGPSPQAFLVVPMVGAFFIDITNTLVIQLYLALPFVN